MLACFSKWKAKMVWISVLSVSSTVTQSLHYGNQYVANYPRILSSFFFWGRKAVMYGMRVNKLKSGKLLDLDQLHYMLPSPWNNPLTFNQGLHWGTRGDKNDHLAMITEIEQEGI